MRGRQFVGRTIRHRLTLKLYRTAVPRSRHRSAGSAHAAPPHGAPPRAATPRALWYRRLPWTPIAITLLLLLAAAFAVSPIRDAATFDPVAEASLAFSPGYLAIAPISDVLDTLTLLTVGQHIALILWAIGVFVVIRVMRARSGGTTARREIAAGGLFLVGLLATYAVAALVPRPMAQLSVSDATVLSVDFHAHTKYSHDGRAGWSEEDVRNWHRAAGYDAAYITDHRTLDGAERGIASNPPLAGEGTMLLQGLEAFFNGEHVNVLSAGRRFKGITTADLKDVDPQALMLASLIPNAAPVVIETMPGNLNKVPALSEKGVPGATAIEVVDGSPRGLSQTRAARARILHIADSLSLALVTGSDNHGWGRTAPGWTLLRIPGWRGMPTDSLSGAIENVLRRGRRDATRPVERVVAGGSDPISLALAGPLVTWRMLTTLGADERVMWLVWTWGLLMLARGLRAYRIRPSSTT